MPARPACAVFVLALLLPAARAACTSTRECAYPAVCIADTCAFCNSTAQCNGARFETLECVAAPAQVPAAAAAAAAATACRHKALFPLHAVDAIAMAVIVVGAVLSAGAGTGGGGIFVPVFMIVLDFTAHEAIPLSKSMILGSALANVLFNMRQRHPAADRPLIDYRLCAMLEPMTMVGTVFGVFLNSVLPTWMIVSFLITLLMFLSYDAFRKGLVVQRREREMRMRGTYDAILDSDEEARVISAYLASIHLRAHESLHSDPGGSGSRDGASSDYEARGGNAGGGPNELAAAAVENAGGAPAGRQRRPRKKHDGDRAIRAKSKQDAGARTAAHESVQDAEMQLFARLDVDLDAPPDTEIVHPVEYVDTQIVVAGILESERGIPLRYLAAQIVSWLVFMVLVLAKGGHGTPVSLFGIAHCSVPYWLVYGAIAVWQTGISFVVARWLVAEYEEKVRLKYTFADGDVRWTPYECMLYPGACVAAGVFAGMLGIGGGMIKSPLMLRMGVLPQVTAASATFMITFTASSTVIQFWLQGLLLPDYALWYAGIGFVATLTGQVILGRIIARYKRVSIIIFLMAGIIFASGILLTSIGMPNVLVDFTKGVNLGFRHPCG